MEVVSQRSMRTTYYFTCLDQEILDEHVLNLSHDDDTWLYTIKNSSWSVQGGQEFVQQNKYMPTNTATTGGSVDSRTFTRRKDSSLANRSSLGLLSSSKLLNNSLQSNSSPKLECLEKTFSSSTVFDTKPVPPRVFKLDTPFMNSANIERVSHRPKVLSSLQRFRFDSESSDISVPPSLENFSPFEKNEAMTDSLVNFLEKQEVNCRPPTAFQDDENMVDSIISLSENQNIHSIEDINGKSELTASLVNFLDPVNCKPPCGFEDNDMVNSMVDVQDSDDIPAGEITNSLMDYLEGVPANSKVPFTENMSVETENIPPNNCNYQDEGIVLNCNDILKASEDKSSLDMDKLNLTYELEESANKRCEETLTLTNSVNIAWKKQSNKVCEDALNLTKTINDSNSMKDYNDKRFRNQTLNHKDFNVGLTENFNRPDDESNTIILSRIGPNKTLKRHGTYVKNETLTVAKQVPLKNSTFNTTFTKLETSTKVLNSTFTKSADGLNGGFEDDQTSSASDSSFSSGSTKPRSIDELRSIVQQQENSLAQQTSTPTDITIKANGLAKMDIQLSPIKRLSNGTCRNSESRSANCSPVRNTQVHSPYPQRLTNLQQSTLESRRQMLQASSLSNIARPKGSGLRLPQPVSRFSVSQKSEPRPISAPAPPPTGIPRPQVSRLPMPRFRGSGIPGPKRVGKH